MVKEDKKTLKKRKSSPEPKVATSKKRKTATPEPKMAEIEEEAPSMPSAAEVEEILKVMIESLLSERKSPAGWRNAPALNHKMSRGLSILPVY
jgi:hypothetical protein